MRTRQTLNLGTERFRVRPWHADPAVAYVTLGADGDRISAAGLRECLERVRAEGYDAVITAALHPDEAQPFLRGGFVEFDRLVVLAHPLTDLAPPRPAPPAQLALRRGRATDRARALVTDHAAFAAEWRLDAEGLRDALHATPRRRFRIAEIGADTVGYAVTGRAQRQGFLQRLAVDPAHSGSGIGSELVVDALCWAARRGATRLLVNTQRGNERALAMYRRLAFAETATDLVVLTRPLA